MKIFFPIFFSSNSGRVCSSTIFSSVKKAQVNEILSFSRSTPSLFHPSSSFPARAPERKTSVERDPTQPKHFHAESFAQGEVENEKMRGLFDGGWKGVEIGPMDYRLNREGQDRLIFESCSCFARCNRCLQLL